MYIPLLSKKGLVNWRFDEHHLANKVMKFFLQMIFVNNIILFCQMVSTYRQRKVYSVMAMESTQHLKDLVIMESGKMTRWMDKVSVTVKVIIIVRLLNFFMWSFMSCLLTGRLLHPSGASYEVRYLIVSKWHQKKKKSEESVFDNMVKKANWKEAASFNFLKLIFICYSFR